MSYGQRSWTWYQRACHMWCKEIFGGASANSLSNRAARVFEEAAELCQCEGVPPDQLQKIVDRAYSRPVGEAKQEVAGVAFTLCAYAHAKGVSIVRCLSTELRRVRKGDPEHYRAKQREKFAAGTDLVPPLP